MQDQKVEINSERFSKKIRKFHSKVPVLESLFNKFTGFQAKNTKNTYFEEHLRTAASFNSQLKGITRIFSFLKKIIEDCH